MLKTSQLTTSVIALLFIFGACTPDEKKESDHEGAGQHEDHGEDHHDDNTVRLTTEQVTNAGIQIGDFEKMNIGEVVQANGEMDLPPENIAAVTSPMEGYVEKVPYLIGDYVKKGATVVSLKHPGFIILQEKYLDAKSKSEFLEQELKRQKELSDENINAKKKLQQTRSEYRSSLAKMSSLKKQLEYIGINPGSVSETNMSSIISIKAPFSGYVTELNVHRGMHVSPEKEIYEMVNLDHMHLEINVFEEDIGKVKKGQNIDFTVPAIGDEWFKGEVHLVGKSFDREKKTVLVHGHLKEEDSAFIRGLYIEAKINTEAKNVAALPENAVVRDKGKSYIFIKIGENEFKAIEVNTGKPTREYIQVMPSSPLPEHKGVVTKGAFVLISELKKGEGGGHGHDH